MEEYYIKISEESVGERIDSFLPKKIDITRTRIQQLIKEKRITVNQKYIKSSYRLENNDELNIFIPEVKKIEILPENIEIDIVYEDFHIVVINKQPNFVVHPAQGHYSGTLVNALLYHIKDLSGINGEYRPGIVHRLDKDTSGLIIIAKNDKAHLELSRMFQNKEIKKTYLAILKGKVSKDTGKIVTQIGRDKEDRKKMTVLKNNLEGKNAITNYKVIDRNEKFSFVEVNIETGRTHQIRVHMKYLGYPILGDSVYGRTDSEKRQMLHAYKLELSHPITNEKLELTGRLPYDFTEAMKKCGFHKLHYFEDEKIKV